MYNEETKKIKEGFVGQQMIVLPPNIKKLVAKNNLTRLFYLTAIGYYPNANFHHRTRKTGSGQHILLYCTSGRGHIYLKDQEIELTPNTFFVIPKNTPHHYKSSIIEPWSIYWVHFTGPTADIIYERYADVTPLLRQIPYSEKRIENFDAIFNLLEESFDEQSLEIANLKLMDFVSSMIYIKQLNPAQHQMDQMDKSILFMKNNINGIFTAETFAKQQQLSLSHYSRLFRSKTGNSPLHFFNQLKVQKACQYLYFTDRNIKEICTELGFDDPFYFSRLFKKYMGISPSQYKKNYRSQR
ncbi:AraC family transcriptional regulator [Pedobacter frigiditerrae]|uniref:AraC family transcriptional regulator n=1 Tax=Pedobacter frigiditerrae TaxID=2530452 RepID=UPI00292DD7A3|nr:AraC family transcriptional regulator [Pedobacter frigiditerrae]